MNITFKHFNKDLPASIVVFFVALPLCLGIALASGAPLFSGLIAGIIGGIVVGAISKSPLGVSGPAAGLAVIVLNAISDLGAYEIFLLAVVLAGFMQILLAVLKAGVIGYYFPTSVIKGMLAGIGIIIFLKQIPVALGYNVTSDDGFKFIQGSLKATISEIFGIVNYISLGAVLLTVVSLGIILLWELYLTKKHRIFKLVPGPLVAVIIGILFYLTTQNSATLQITSDNLVNVPVPDGFNSFIGQFTLPNFSEIFNYQVWVVAFTIAVVASLETLLCVEATDKQDPKKRVTPTNRELFAQGIGNSLSGLIGGLPITQVIVRSSANMQAGGQTKLSAIMHGFLLLFSIILIPTLLNLIPLSVLAAVLLVVGYKLAKPSLFKHMYKLGNDQFYPFIVTVLAIIFTDLLIGIGLGLAVGITIVLLNNYKNSHFLHIEDKSNGSHKIKMVLSEEISFLNKAAIQRELANLPKDTLLEIDVTKTVKMNYDIIEILDDFVETAKERNIDITLTSEKESKSNPEKFSTFFGYK